MPDSRRFRFLLGALLLSAACSDQSPEPDPLRVGVILAQSGPAAFIGQPEAAVLNALMAARTDRGFTLDIRDSGGDATRAQTLFDEFAADSNVIAVIGPSTSGESIALGARADASRLVLLSLAAAKRIVFDDDGSTRPYVFKFAQNDELAAFRLADAMRRNDETTVAMLYSDDAFGTGGAESFRSAAALAGIQLTTDASYAAQLQSADAVVAQVAPDAPAVIIWGTTPGPPLIVKALRQRGYAGRIYLSHGNASGAFLLDAGAAAEGAFVVGSRLLISPDRLVAGNATDDVIRAFLTLWAGVSSGTPSTFGGHARDALEALTGVADQELRALGPTARRLAVRTRLEALRDFRGVTGTFSFASCDHAGLSETAFELYRIESGRFAIQPPDATLYVSSCPSALRRSR